MSEKMEVQTIPYYLVINKCSGMALDVVDDMARVFFPMGTALQCWCFEDRGGGYVTIMNRGTHQVLDVDMAAADNGSAIHMWNSVRADNQLWVLEPAGKDTYRIRSKHSGRYLDIVDQSLDARAQLHIWDKTTSETQLWMIKQVMEGGPNAEFHDPDQDKKSDDVKKETVSKPRRVRADGKAAVPANRSRKKQETPAVETAERSAPDAPAEA